MTMTRIILIGFALFGVVAVAALLIVPATRGLSNPEITRLQVLAGQARDGASEQRLRVEAGNGVTQAQVALGQVLIAQPLAAQVAEGMAWLRKASAAGSHDAQATLGRLYLRGAIGMAPDYARAFTLLQAAAEKNDAGASYTLALMHKNGLGVPQDSAAAAHWFEVAANGKSPAAMFLLANMILSGDGVQYDERKARGLIERAAGLDYPEAVQMMAMGFRDGTMGFERDAKQASEQFLEVSHALKHRPQDP